MEDEYPIKRYEPPIDTTVLTTRLTGKMGKVIEIVFKYATPEIVNFNIISNRGVTKDSIEIPSDQVHSFAKMLLALSTFHPKDL